ncbi:MAG: BadF/BadG/BcrA/BcrD ATPase family protein [Planctomycetota bacterium]
MAAPDHELVVGVDGGGTSTRVVVGAPDGRVLGEGSAGSGNLHDVGAERLAENIGAAWRDASTAGGVAPDPDRTTVLCAMASVGTAPERARVADLVAGLGIAPPERVTVDVDLIAALAAALGGEPGVAVIAGTGSSCLGRDPSGARWQAGGWGSLLDDVGGATWVGTQAMVAAVRAHDGRGEATALTGMVQEQFGLAHLRELLVRVDANHLPRGERAALAPLVTAAAEEGDRAALGILRRGAEALAECVGAAVRRLDFGAGEVLVGVTGGLADGVPAYRELCHDEVHRTVPSARCVEPRTDNARGAFLEALRVHQGGTLRADVRARALL